MTLFPLGLVLASTVLHAGWNVLARRFNDRDLFLPILVIISAVGLGPALSAEWWGEPILPLVWRHVALAGFFEALYYLGLLRGYQSGDFSVVYPAARAVPVLVLAAVDVLLGRPPSPWGWVGLGLVALGCFLLPLPSLRAFSWEPYRKPVMGWIGVTAVGMVGYTLVDRLAAQAMPPGWQTAVRYGVFEFAATTPGYWLLLRRLRPFAARPRPPLPRLPLLTAAALMFGAYALVLWAYQLATHVGYVVAVRQFSIVLGAAAGALLFREPAPRLRIALALVIVSGVALIALRG